MINDKLLVILDETKGKDTFLNDEKLKNYITTNKIAWERKGIDGFSINNFARLLFFTNGDTPVPIPFGDRRFACFNCSNELANNRVYFKKLVKQMKDDKVAFSFYEFLRNRDITDFDVVADRPETDFYKELRQESIPCIARFLISYIENVDNERNIYAKALYDKFKSWCENTSRKVSYTDNRFGRELRKYNGIDKRHTRKGSSYLLDFDSIRKSMIDKHYLTEEECCIGYDSDSESD